MAYNETKKIYSSLHMDTSLCGFLELAFFLVVDEPTTTMVVTSSGVPRRKHGSFKLQPRLGE